MCDGEMFKSDKPYTKLGHWTRVKSLGSFSHQLIGVKIIV